MSTSSPGEHSARRHRSMPSLAPMVTRISSAGSYSTWQRRRMYSAIRLRSWMRPQLEVYCVRPSSIDVIAASRMCQGVMKSGSPTPREMASGISATMSKNLRMPLGGTARTRWLTMRSRSITGSPPDAGRRYPLQR